MRISDWSSDVCSSDLGPPGDAAAQDLRRHRDGLDVVDGGRAAVEADGGGERRLQARLALLALQAFQQRGLLAAAVGAGAAVHVDLVVVAAADGVLAEAAGGAGLFARHLDLRAPVAEHPTGVDVPRR